MFLTILLIILCCYAFTTIVMSFIMVILDWEGFSSHFREDERTQAIIILVAIGPILLVAAFFMILIKPILRRTVWREQTKTVTEETVSVSLSKALKDYNKYFEKN